MTIKYITTINTGNQKFYSSDELVLFSQSLPLLKETLDVLQTFRNIVKAGLRPGMVISRFKFIDTSNIQWSIEFENEQIETKFISALKQKNLYVNLFSDACDNPNYQIYFNALGWNMCRQKYVDGVLIAEKTLLNIV